MFFEGPLLLLVHYEGQVGLCDSSWLCYRQYSVGSKLWEYCICYQAVFSLPFAQGTCITYTINANMLIPASRGKFTFCTQMLQDLRC